MRGIDPGEGGLLSRLPDADRATLEAAARRRVFPRGAVLFMEGDLSHHVLVVVGGLVKLTKGSPDGREILIELRGPGEVLGELSALDGEPRSATGVVVDPAEILVLDNARFRELLIRSAPLANEVLTTVVTRLREASARQLELGTADALGRVARRLTELADRGGDHLDGVVRVPSPLSQHELAEWAGLSRDAVVRALTTLRRLGWVETSRRHFLIHDLEALRRRADGV